MEMSTPVYPASLPVGGMGYGGTGFGGALGGTAIGALFGLLLGNGGLGLGGNAGLNTAINANQSGEIAGLQAGIASLQASGNTDAIINKIDGTQDLVSMLSTAQANGNFTTLQSINGLGRDVTNVQTQGIIQALNTANLTNSIMQQGFNEIGRDTTTATNQLIMGQNALATQLASCCCSVSQKISEDGALTRALINDLNVQRLTSELNDAKNSISNTSQTNALIAAMAAQTNTILHHIPVLMTSKAVV